ncbi:hypothetical protein [Candidatus Ichthyocystis hellenicum]|nr:hypothetical protein [Candidatus Ichthyocystis hellenicum]
MSNLVRFIADGPEGGVMPDSLVGKFIGDVRVYVCLVFKIWIMI